MTATCSAVPPASGTLDARQGGRQARPGVLLVEAGPLAAARAADQRQRPPGQVRQHAVGHGQQVLGECLLGDTLVRVEDAPGMGEADAGHQDGVGVGPRLAQGTPPSRAGLARTGDDPG